MFKINTGLPRQYPAGTLTESKLVVNREMGEI